MATRIRIPRWHEVDTGNTPLPQLAHKTDWPDKRCHPHMFRRAFSRWSSFETEETRSACKCSSAMRSSLDNL